MRIFGLPPGLPAAANHAGFHLLVARADGTDVATTLAIDFEGDCGIYNVTTLERARPRGLGTALTVDDGLSRGCQTPSLQSTEMAESVYAAVGLRDIGRFLESRARGRSARCVVFSPRRQGAPHEHIRTGGTTARSGDFVRNATERKSSIRSSDSKCPYDRGTFVVLAWEGHKLFLDQRADLARLQAFRRRRCA